MCDNGYTHRREAQEMTFSLCEKKRALKEEHKRRKLKLSGDDGFNKTLAGNDFNKE